MDRDDPEAYSVFVEGVKGREVLMAIALCRSLKKGTHVEDLRVRRH